MMNTKNVDGNGIMEHYNCQGKPDGTECYCLYKIETCTPRGGARCWQGTCAQGTFWLRDRFPQSWMKYNRGF